MSNQSRGEIIPPDLRSAMMVARLANADWASYDGNGMRYVVERQTGAQDSVIGVLDALEGVRLSVSELTERLPENLRKRILFM
uniref:Uncharacterized protein n=1 Tax=Leviviridae sp. TaxID=2027243 RepID=A0A514D2G6_9VIRU|nr:MAG: hypothetical protein H1Bulk291512_000002 [Leviviridae sp.]